MSITVTVLLKSFVIYANGPVREALCTEAADAVDEMRINNKIRADDVKTTEYNLSGCLKTKFYSTIVIKSSTIRQI
jgi:hypothetical protein